MRILASFTWTGASVLSTVSTFFSEKPLSLFVVLRIRKEKKANPTLLYTVVDEILQNDCKAQ